MAFILPRDLRGSRRTEGRHLESNHDSEGRGRDDMRIIETGLDILRGREAARLHERVG
jgi:hypothetical protein